MIARLFCLLVVLASTSWAESIAGRVVGVSDGDTLTILTGTKRQVKIRLSGIDAPESKQAFGQRAKQALSDLAFGKHARAEIETTDRYGRRVARVFVGDVDVNGEMVRSGFAWWYRAYAQKDRELQRLESEARSGKRGLWQDPAPVAPWEFRKRKGAVAAAPSE